MIALATGADLLKEVIGTDHDRLPVPAASHPVLGAVSLVLLLLLLLLLPGLEADSCLVGAVWDALAWRSEVGADLVVPAAGLEELDLAVDVAHLDRVLLWAAGVDTWCTAAVDGLIRCLGCLCCLGSGEGSGSEGDESDGELHFEWLLWFEDMGK